MVEGEHLRGVGAVRVAVDVDLRNVDEATLRKQIVGFINQVRTLDLKKLPSVSETIDWARVLVLLQSTELDHETVKDTLNVLLKYEADIETTMPQVTTFVAKAGRQGVFG